MVFLRSLSSCDELSLFLWGFIIVGLNTLDLRTLDVCLACGYPWWQWGNLLSHLMYVLVINLRIPWPWGNQGIWVGTRFHPSFSDRNFGVLFEVLCVDWILWIWSCFDAHGIINSRILVVTLEYLGDIRVGWCISYGVILVQTPGLFVTLRGMAQ